MFTVYVLSKTPQHAIRIALLVDAVKVTYQPSFSCNHTKLLAWRIDVMGAGTCSVDVVELGATRLTLKIYLAISFADVQATDLTSYFSIFHAWEELRVSSLGKIVRSLCPVFRHERICMRS